MIGVDGWGHVVIIESLDGNRHLGEITESTIESTPVGSRPCRT